MSWNNDLHMTKVSFLLSCSLFFFNGNTQVVRSLTYHLLYESFARKTKAESLLTAEKNVAEELDFFFSCL